MRYAPTAGFAAHEPPLSRIDTNLSATRLYQQYQHTYTVWQTIEGVLR